VDSNDLPPAGSPTPEQIISALNKTGFIFEHQVAQRLLELESDFRVMLNDAFDDPDTGKSREIDIVASAYNNIQHDNLAKIIVNATLLIECKNYSDPLVIIGQSNDFRFHNNGPVITFDPLLFDFSDRNPENYGGIYLGLGMWKLPSHTTEGFIGRQLVKMYRKDGKWQSTNQSIYDSIIYPLAKAAESERALEEDSSSDSEAQPWYLPTFTYIFPVLVTAGTIYTVDVMSGDSPIVAEAPWVPLIRHFSKSSFMMDVVRFECLETYVSERILPRLAEASELLTRNIDVFNPEQLRQQFGECSDPIFAAWLENYRTSTEGGS
jgi:hypothetical protein